MGKDTGGIHDFVEILKLYDKNSDKTMLSKDLFRLLTNLGEKLTKEEAKGLLEPQSQVLFLVRSLNLGLEPDSFANPLQLRFLQLALSSLPMGTATAECQFTMEQGDTCMILRGTGLSFTA